MSGRTSSAAATGWTLQGHPDQEEKKEMDMGLVQRLIDQNLQVFQKQLLSGDVMKNLLRNHGKELKFQMKKQKDDT